MQRWQTFLNSFNTPGGNLFLLFGFVIGLLSLVLHLLHHPGDSNISTVLTSTFSAFAGALLKGLSGRTTDIPAAPGTTTTTTTQATQVPGPLPAVVPQP